jgi:D-threo-aldose 1-dehydrogenase
LCQRFAVPLAAAALQFSLRDPRITSTIVGISKPERVQETLTLAHHPIPEELWQAMHALAGNIHHD